METEASVANLNLIVLPLDSKGPGIVVPQNLPIDGELGFIPLKTYKIEQFKINVIL